MIATIRSLLLALALTSSPAFGQKDSAIVRRDTLSLTPGKVALGMQVVKLLHLAENSSFALGTLTSGIGAAATEHGDAVGRAMRDWTALYLPADSIDAINARAWAREYSEDDLRTQIGFFTSPAGQRYVLA